MAKLCDVGPDGRSRPVTLGWSPDAGEGGAGHRVVEVRLRHTAYLFRRGHRIRLKLAPADFPRLWSAPLVGEISLAYPSDSMPRLLLPRTQLRS